MRRLSSRLAGRSPFSDSYVAQGSSAVLRAFRILASVVLLAPLTLIACGGSEHGSAVPAGATATPTQTPTATFTPTSTATPIPSATPTVSITYRLTEGSTILFVPPTPSASPTGPQSLSGTFSVAQSEPWPPNTLFQFTVMNIDFRTPSGLTVSSGHPGPFGCDGELGLGCLSAVTIDQPPRAWLSAIASIDGDEVWLAGAGPREAASSLPTFQYVEICGGAAGLSADCGSIHDGTASGYDLIIFAIPEG